MPNHTFQYFPPSRIATIDIGEIGKRKHHISALIEVDVSKGLEKIKTHHEGSGNRITFSGWLISVISRSIKQYETAAAYRAGKRKLLIFEDINVSVVVEKDIDGQKVPIPLVIEKAHEKSPEAITRELTEAKNAALSSEDIVIRRKTRRLEKLYYRLPGIFRRAVWKYLLRHPKLAYEKMGNVAFTSVGMMGRVDGWFVPISIHPICFGLGSTIKKPAVVEGRIEIRDMLKMSILMDHDVIDGAIMARFIHDLVLDIEGAAAL